jgi:hypothetical protein
MESIRQRQSHQDRVDCAADFPLEGVLQLGRVPTPNDQRQEAEEVLRLLFPVTTLRPKVTPRNPGKSAKELFISFNSSLLRKELESSQWVSARVVDYQRDGHFSQKFDFDRINQTYLPLKFKVPSFPT